VKISWDEWRGSFDGRPAMLIKRLFSWRGYRVDLHKFVRGDDPECFHTHPATAIRIVLWGGYVEEVERGKFVTWKPGRVGIVRPALCHRVASLLRESSYSLWLRGPVTAKVEIRGQC
jgi:hypothetical protein